MQLEWRYESRPDLGVLALAGHLDAESVQRLHGALGWTLYHGAGPLILDLSAVPGWTVVGRAAVIDAARRLAAAGRPLEVAAAPEAAWGLTNGGQVRIRIHADLAAALAAHDAPSEPAGAFREWRSDDWPQAADA